MSDKHRVCPWWLGYFLMSPLRRFYEDPERILNPYIREGMTVLEPGSGMGYFTKEIARLVGPSGRVVAVDIQPRMLAGLRRRMKRAGLLDRLDARLTGPDTLGIDDLAGKVDLAVLFHVIHEMPDQSRLFRDLLAVLKPGANLLVAEPRGHVSEKDFAVSLDKAETAGFELVGHPGIGSNRTALLRRRFRVESF